MDGKCFTPDEKNILRRALLTSILETKQVILEAQMMSSVEELDEPLRDSIDEIVSVHNDLVSAYKKIKDLPECD